MELAPGAFVTPQIRLVRPMRRGGMGSVWLAEHLALRCEVVVKLMSEQLAADPTSLARFSREAAAAAQVRSPHVIQVLDHGVTTDGRPFIVMELLDGRDLAESLRDRALSPAETAHVVEHIARALSRAHERGVLHRDIKPANIFLCDVGAPEPFVKLIDFGIAKGIHDTSEVTSTGAMVGTPQYMSPEQIQGSKDIDLRTDIWSVGVVAFRCMTGAAPFVGDSLVSVAFRVMDARRPRPSEVRPELPPAVDAWFAKACAHDRAQRFSSARAMADALWVAIGMAPPASSGTSLPRVEALIPGPSDGAGDGRPGARGDTTASGVNAAIPAGRPRDARAIAAGAGAGAALAVVGVAAVTWMLVTSGTEPGASPGPGASATTEAQRAPAADADTAAPSPRAPLSPAPVEASASATDTAPAMPAASATAMASAVASASAAPAPAAPRKAAGPSRGGSVASPPPAIPQRPPGAGEEPDDGF